MDYSVYFDEKRRRYIVRSRHRGRDVKRTVPRELFEKAEIPYDEPSKRAERIAQSWAAENTRKRAAAMSLKELFALYASRNPNAVAAATLDRNAELAANVVRILGHLLPAEIDIDAATEYRNLRAEEQKHGRKTRARTIANELGYLKHVLAYGYESRRTTGMSELSLLRLPVIRKEESLGIALTMEELKKIFSAPIDSGGNIIRRKWYLALAIGIRLRPLNEFRREWVRNGEIHLPGEVMKGGRALVIPATQSVREVVGDGEGLAFANSRGRPMRWPHETVATIVATTDVRDWSAHDLRRTFATMLYELGVDKLTRSRLMGHATGDVTDTYTFDSKERMRDAAERLEKHLEPLMKLTLPRKDLRKKREPKLEQRK